MALTQLDDRSALFVVDLQDGVRGAAMVHNMATVISNSVLLANRFRASPLPVVLVNVDGAPDVRTERPRRAREGDGWTRLIDELNAQASDILVTKRAWSAFIGTQLDEQLRDLGVTEVVVAGVATSIGVESTARHASDLGYNVVIVTDAVTDMNVAAHDNSTTWDFPRLGETGTTDELVRLLRA